MSSGKSDWVEYSTSINERLHDRRLAHYAVRDECLSKVSRLGEHHLREVLREYVVHYHAERNHQGLANRLLEPTDDNSSANGRVVQRKRLGGILSYHQREAA